VKAESINGRRIALLVDNPLRDLSGLVLVAWYLCQKGADCHLVPMNLRNTELWPLAPDFVLLNHFRTIYEQLVRDLMGAGIAVGVLDTEGSIFSPVPASARGGADGPTPDDGDVLPAMEEYALSMARSSELRDKVSSYCAWSSQFAEYANHAGWYRSDQIAVTGAPRMDFFAPQWRPAARAMSSHVDTFPKPLILVNSSFTLANPRFQSADQEAEMMVSKFSYDRDYVTKWLKTQRAALEGLASVANAVAGRFPAATVIYRPHPFEGESVYQTLLKPLPNLHLVKEGTVDGWLLRAKALIHWGSSTAIESCLADVPAFTAGWLPRHLPVPSVDAVSIECSSEDELVRNIGRALEDDFPLPAEVTANLQQVVDKSFFKIDGCGHQRVGDAILGAVDGAGASPGIGACRRHTYRPAGPSLRARLSARAKAMLRLPPHWSFKQRRSVLGELSWDRSDKRFDADQVRGMVEAIQACAAATAGRPLRRINTMPADERGDYHFGYEQGRSVAVFPEREGNGMNEVTE
jgi:surface carbohydrate biosynthesis protein